MAINTLSVQTGSSSKLLSGTSKSAIVASSTGHVSTSPIVSPATFPITTGSIKNPLLHTPIVPWQNTLTIVIELPGHQTLSYNPVVENLEELVVSLESLIYAHKSKRDLATASPEPAGSVSQLSGTDSTAHRHQHGHQHDHLHNLNRARDLGSSSTNMVPRRERASVTGGPFATSDTGATATADQQPTGTVADISGAASLSDYPMDQSGGTTTNVPPLADDQDPPLGSTVEETAVPESFLADQSTVSQESSPYPSTSSTGVATDNADTQSRLHLRFSAAERVSPLAETGFGSYAVMCGLWVIAFAVF